MIPTFDKIHNRFKLNGNSFNAEELKEVGYSFIKEGLPFEREMGDFLLDWLNDKPFIVVNTSGSTGKPKSVKVQKQAMVNSAIVTGDTFGLKPGDTALHCLPTKFIAGKMMLVRAMILGLELDVIEPKRELYIIPNKHYHFCAMIPLQLQNSLEITKQIDTIIVGGAAVSQTLKEQIQSLTSKVYATYGMTETVSHIAIKPLNGKQAETAHFKVLKDVKISQNDDDCLVIQAPHLYDGAIITNDVVKLYSDTEFEILGRLDNVINSGGIKLHPEQIEQKLQPYMSQRFFVTSIPDDSLGEQLILVVEGDVDNLSKEVFKNLDKYERPKQIFGVPQFVETENKKVQRVQTLALIEA